MLNPKIKATRRVGAEGLISLNRWRSWFAGEPGQDAQNQSAPDGAENGEVPIENLPQATQAYIKELRDEAANYRIKLKKAEDAAREREQKVLADQGNFKTLAEQRAAEIAALQPYQERAQTLEALIRAGNEARIKQISEPMRVLIPTSLSPEQLSAWLDTSWSMLQPQRAPNLDAGAGAGGGGVKVQVTDADRAAAAAATASGYPVTPEQVAARRSKT